MNVFYFSVVRLAWVAGRIYLVARHSHLGKDIPVDGVLEVDHLVVRCRHQVAGRSHLIEDVPWARLKLIFSRAWSS